MTRHIHWIIAILALAITAMPADAKRPQQPKKPDAAAVAAKLAKAACMNDEQTKTFTTLFTECYAEMDKVHEQYRFDDSKNPTSKQIEQNTENRFALSRAILDIREKYYKKYKQFLSAEQIDRMYRMEKRLMGPPPMDKNKGKGKGKQRKRQSPPPPPMP